MNLTDLTNVLPSLVGVILANPGWLVTVLLSGTGVSIVLQVIKHYGRLQDAKKIVMFLLAALSIVATYADQLFAFSNQNPGLFMAHNLSWVIVVAVFAHRFAVSPLYHKITDFLTGIYADAQAYRAEQTALAAAPVVTASTNTVDTHEFELPQQ